MKNILEFLEKNAEQLGDKKLFCDTESFVTINQTIDKGQRIGTVLGSICNHDTVAIYCKRNTKALVSMMGVLYSGNSYIILDSDSPAERLVKILQVVKPKVILYEESLANKIAELGQDYKYVLYENAIEQDINQDYLASVRKSMISTDVMYYLFTSGSTGTPKGTVVTHQNVITYIDWFVKTFDISSSTVFGSQTPFYFSMSVSDIFASVVTGATFHIVPKMYFSFPMKLVEYLNERQINTIYWVPSAMSIVANIKLFNYAKPQYLTKVLFAGEVMPNKQLNYWRKNLPNCMYANLFGPTETTDICTYYIVNRDFRDDQSLPIGIPCDNCDTFLVDDNNQRITEVGVMGELYVRGGFVAQGYYDNVEKSNQAFVQNPLNNHFREIVYKTGDLVKLNEYGEYEYLCRKDFQIKHMGYRIELGEIETCASAIENIDSVVTIYDSVEDKIILIYVGKAESSNVVSLLKDKVPYYMCPNVVIKTQSMPYNQNGKIDRAWLNKNYKTMIKD